MSLTPEELDRHRRHILLKEIGGPGVQKLRAAHVSIIGAGALGGPCALLQRQVQFTDKDVGATKAETLAARLRAMDPSIKVEVKAERFGEGAAPAGDILIDASDNFPTRYALNRLAHETGRAMVHGAAAGWSGQVSVFASGLQADAPCYQCWVPETPPDTEACDEVGVVGALTGMTGTAMAMETVKLITGAGRPLIGRVLLIDGLSAESRTVTLRRDSGCPVCAIR